jgi:Cu/Ag efflux pump CusA
VEVTGRFEGVDLGTGIAAVQKTVAAMQLPSSIRVEYGGIYQEQQKSFHDLLMVLFLALLLLFVVLLFEFRTFSAPIAILASALLSTFGGFLALLVTRTTFNVASFMGMIMVIGIVAKNGILLLDAEHHFRDSIRASTVATDRNDGARDDCRHAAAGVRHRGRLADAAAVGHRGCGRATELHGALSGVYAGHKLLLATENCQ